MFDSNWNISRLLSNLTNKSAGLLRLYLLLSPQLLVSTMAAPNSLHVVMLPWSAMGHLIPFLELSKRLACCGHHISLLTTPRNAARLLPKIPRSLSSLLTLVSIPLDRDSTLPESIQSTNDLPSEEFRNSLHAAYDTTFARELPAFLRRSPADWIIYDFSGHWVPRISAEFRISCVYLCLFNAAALSFFGPSSSLRGVGTPRLSPEQWTNAPEWIPFPTKVAFKTYEIRELLSATRDSAGASFAEAIDGSPFVAIRSCTELEGEWLGVLSKIHQKPVVPVGLFPPSDGETGTCEGWDCTCEWLDGREPGSVVYVAFGSEAKLSPVQVKEIADGLEMSGLPFVWALRAGSDLPEGFEEKIQERGLVLGYWVPQVRILGHRSVGGFLTHGGWNSIVEGLSAGAAMVMLPMMFEQGLNARGMAEKGIGVEVERDEDGGFSGKIIAESLRFVMVDEKGDSLRAKARECARLYGNEELNKRYVAEFVELLMEKRQSKPTCNGVGEELEKNS